MYNYINLTVLDAIHNSESRKCIEDVIVSLIKYHN